MKCEPPVQDRSHAADKMVLADTPSALAGQPDERDHRYSGGHASLPPRRATPGLHRLRKRPARHGADARSAALAEDADAACARAGLAGQSRDHVRSPRSRCLGSAAGYDPLLDVGVRQAGGRAARPSGHRPSGGRRHVAGRKHHARGGADGAGAAARHDPRDAGARQRDSGLCGCVHAAVVRADLRRTGDEARRAARPGDPR